MHDIKSIGLEIDIPLITYVKAKYPTYSHYLDSLQANGNLKEIIFDSLENKFAKREKGFGKKTTPQSTEKYVSFTQKNHAQDSSRGRGGQRGRERRNFGGKGANSSKEKSLIFIAYVAIVLSLGMFYA